MNKVFLVFLGGGVGSLLRYGTTLLFARLLGTSYPWGTAIVNLFGCFLIGLIYGLAERTQWIGPSARLFLMTGFLGGLTTFSTFSLESVNAYRTGGLAVFLINLLVHNVGGLSLAVLGMAFARWIR